MNKKLKTLKDIKIRRPQGIELSYLDWYKEELKKEAIKWINYLRKNPKRESTESQAEILIDFFDIEGKDLK